MLEYFALFSHCLPTTWFHAIFKETQFAKCKMFLCAIKDKELFFPPTLHINLFCFLSIHHTHYAHISWLVCTDEGNTMLVETSKWLKFSKEVIPVSSPCPVQVVSKPVLCYRVTDKLLQSRQLAHLDSSCWLSSPWIETPGPALVWRESFSWRVKDS